MKKCNLRVYTVIHWCIMEVTRQKKGKGKMKKHLTQYNLCETITNSDGTTDLRFEVNDTTIWVMGVKLPDNVSEFYFDDDDNVLKAVETGRIEY